MPLPLRASLFLIAGLILLFGSPQTPAPEPAETFCVLHQFGAPNAKDADLSLQPAGIIAFADDGSMWTTVSQGGDFSSGAIIKMTPDGQYTKVTSLNKGTTGAGPQGGLVNGKDGNMYGATYSGGKWGVGTIFRVSQQGGDPEVIYDFRNGRYTGLQPKDCTTPLNCTYSPQQKADMAGGYPVSGPVVIGGNLYGVTSYSDAQSYGTLYTIPTSTAPRSNTFTATTPEDGDDKMHVLCIFQPSLANDPVMKSFRCNTNGITAAFLTTGQAGSVNAGVLYGTTVGVNGSVFKATTGGQVTSLHEFNGKDGTKPFAIMQASDGKLYGTASAGGTINWGALYQIDPATNSFVSLSNFTQPADGSYRQGQFPVAGVVEGSDGQLYGALALGGLYGRGVLFHVAKDGSNFGILHEFYNATDGAKPVTTPVIVEDTTNGTTLYGTTDLGGAYLLGTFYRMRVNRLTITRGIPVAAYGIVDVRGGVTATQGAAKVKEVDNGIAVRVACSDLHFVQFIYREVIQPTSASVPPGGESQPNGKLLDNSSLANPCCQTTWGTPYALTTDLANIQWNAEAPNVPSATSAGSAFFEEGPYHSAERDCDSLALFDRPELPAADVSGNRVSRAVVRDYAMCAGAVKMQVTWIADQTMDQNQQPHWTYHAWISPATKIPDYFLCMLQKNNYPLPAGQAISAGVDCTNLPPAKAGTP